VKRILAKELICGLEVAAVALFNPAGIQTPPKKCILRHCEVLVLTTHKHPLAWLLSLFTGSHSLLELLDGLLMLAVSLTKLCFQIRDPLLKGCDGITDSN